MTAETRYAGEIAEIVRESGVRIGVSVWRCGPESSVGYGEHDTFPLASVAKLLTAVAALKIQEQGGIDHTLSLRQLTMAAISRHDQAAADRLCALSGGVGKVNEMLAGAGFDSLTVLADNSQPGNCGSPHDLTSLLRQVAEGTLLCVASTGLVLRALAEQVDPDGLLSGLPADVTWLHMTGGLPDVCNDVGILRCIHGVLICAVCTEGLAPWNELEAIVGRIGTLTYDHWCTAGVDMRQG